MNILETERLILREMDSASDAEFVLELQNSPGFLKYIGDRGVRTVADATTFIETRYRQSYHDHGYGLYVIELKAISPDASNIPDSAYEPVGICGFVRRDSLPGPDIGFALLPEYEEKGYGVESAAAMMKYGRETLGFGVVLAITSLDNENSERLLAKVGFKFDRLITLPHSDEKLKLYSSAPAATAV